jgi:hypothetical protein
MTKPGVLDSDCFTCEDSEKQEARQGDRWDVTKRVRMSLEFGKVDLASTHLTSRGVSRAVHRAREVQGDVSRGGERLRDMHRLRQLAAQCVGVVRRLVRVAQCLKSRPTPHSAHNL